MREYESCFAPLIRDFVAYRLASGRWNEASYGPNMRVFDRYCKANYPNAQARDIPVSTRDLTRFPTHNLEP